MKLNKPTHKALLQALHVVQSAVDALPIEAYAEGESDLQRLRRLLEQHYLYRSDVRLDKSTGR